MNQCTGSGVTLGEMGREARERQKSQLGQDMNFRA